MRKKKDAEVQVEEELSALGDGPPSGQRGGNGEDAGEGASEGPAATTLTTQDIENALRWLDGVKYKYHTVQNVPSGMAEYIEALKTVNINGDVTELTDFIVKHQLGVLRVRY